MRTKLLSLILVLAVLTVAGITLWPQECKAPPHGIDRFNEPWSSYSCPTPQCPAATLYAPDWCPQPYCEECGQPLDATATGLDYSTIGSGERLIWLEETTK